MTASISANVIPIAAGAAAFSALFARVPRLILPGIILLTASAAVFLLLFAAALRGRCSSLHRLGGRLSLLLFALLGFLLAGSRRFALEAWDSGASTGVPAASIIGCAVDLSEDPARLPGQRWAAEGFLVNCSSGDITADSRGPHYCFRQGQSARYRCRSACGIHRPVRPRGIRQPDVLCLRMAAPAMAPARFRPQGRSGGPAARRPGADRSRCCGLSLRPGSGAKD